MRSLSCGIMHHLNSDTQTLFRYGEFPPKQSHQVSALAVKLNDFATLLKLTPYNSKGRFIGKVLPISYTTIQAVLTICPNSVV